MLSSFVYPPKNVSLCPNCAQMMPKTVQTSLNQHKK